MQDYSSADVRDQLNRDASKRDIELTTSTVGRNDL